MREGWDFARKLTELGLRPTGLRLSLLNALAAAGRACTAGELLAHLRRSRQVNKVTVYRLLWEFTARGLVRRVAAQGKAARFELAWGQPPHPHFQCDRCGAVQCLEPVSLEEVWAVLKGPLGHRADRLEIRVTGLCRECRRRE
jgi:Fur family ferric uptake transcriptional regulator